MSTTKLRLESPYYRAGLLFRLWPTLLKHYIFRPYHRDLPAAGYRMVEALTPRKRSLSALYGAMYNILLDGYAELSGARLSPHTGRMFVLLLEMTRRIDEHIDANVDSPSRLQMEDVLNTDRIQSAVLTFRRYLNHFDCQDCVTTFLRSQFAEHYQSYIRRLTSTTESLTLPEALDAAKIDTGMWLASAFTVVALFNGHEPNEALLKNFYHVGMCGKFADDMIDLSGDMKSRRTNILHSLLHEHPQSLLLVKQAIDQPKSRLSLRWWRANCPVVLKEYLSYFDYYYQKLENKKLRFAAGLLMLPALSGRDYDRVRSKSVNIEHGRGS